MQSGIQYQILRPPSTNVFKNNNYGHSVVFACQLTVLSVGVPSSQHFQPFSVDDKDPSTRDAECVLEEEGPVQLDSGDHLGLGGSIKQDVTASCVGKGTKL